VSEIAVWGLGKMGLPLAAVLAHAGYTVTGIDVDEKKVEIIIRGENPYPAEPGLNEMLSSVVQAQLFSATTNPVKANIHIIIVPILLENKKADFSIVLDVLKKIATVLRKGDIVVLESTAPPGTCDTKVKPVLEQTGLKAGLDFGIAHAPERTMAGSALEDITQKYPKIVGASDEDTSDTLVKMYSEINQKGVILMRNTKTAEAVKVFEGVYRDVNIALANELACYCERTHIDVTEVIAAANTQPYCHLHNPGVGVGGHCIPVYPYFIMSDSTPLIKKARKINEHMPEYTVNLIEKKLKTHGIPPKKAKALLLGIAFRGGVKEERFSPFFTVRDKLLAKGIQVCAFDPLFTKEETEAYKVKYNPGFSGVDVVVILTDHKEFCQLDWDRIYHKGARIIIDGRNILDSHTLREKGFDCIGIGISTW
jgi:UDP-N-acetyl-D-mannosaminuronic acid dehydrogenase